MLFRFSLYGFLKNQRYFEPFLVLAFLEKGLSFFLIGLLIAFREITVNALEIPSGAAADLHGRRRCMILSFVSYIVSFVIFGLAENLGPLFLAMFFFGAGEAFRTGTHKAMIFTWLRLQGRTDERAKFYGFTRSWSKIGSALSVVLAAAFVFVSGNYVYVFFFSIIPYMAGLINFLGYPRELDLDPEHKPARARMHTHLMETFREVFRKPGLRRLVAESMGFEGIFHAVKDYLQPVLHAAAAAWLAGLAAVPDWTDERRSALMVGAVYFGLYLLSAWASRQSHRVAGAARGEEQAARLLWGAGVIVFGALFLSALGNIFPVLIAAFVLLHVLQNFWRPILISRFGTRGNEAQGATVLSIESQSQRLATMAAAPLLGLAVDFVSARHLGGRFWPAGAAGLAAALYFYITARRGREK